MHGVKVLKTGKLDTRKVVQVAAIYQRYDYWPPTVLFAALQAHLFKYFVYVWLKRKLKLFRFLAEVNEKVLAKLPI